MAQPLPRGQVSEAHEWHLPVGSLSRELDDASLLLSHASETGVEVEESIRDAILRARSIRDPALSTQAAAELLAALGSLAARLKPVTAESLRACANPKQVRRVIRMYTLVALFLSLVLLPASVISFVSSTISDSIRKDLETGNALALNLVDEMRSIQPIAAPSTPTQGATSGPPSSISPKEMLKELQQFAVTIRALNSHAKALRRFAPGTTDQDSILDAEEGKPNHGAFELKVPLLDLQADAEEAAKKVVLYQSVRHRAVSAQEAAAIWIGAFGNCILPVLYAVLGACAYLLRMYEEQIRTRAFTTDGHAARFFIAAIGGLVIGLFNNFNVAQGGSLSPFALAFLVGYAVDVFFSFLEGLLRTFGKTGNAAEPSSTIKTRAAT
jgi:hypothetical protein